MAEEKDRDIHPWRIYGKEFKVPESKMGKAQEDTEKSMEKSLQMLEEMEKSATKNPGDEAIDLLKSASASMKKRYMGEVKFGEGKPKFEGGEEHGKTPGEVGDPVAGTERDPRSKATHEGLRNPAALRAPRKETIPSDEGVLTSAKAQEAKKSADVKKVWAVNDPPSMKSCEKSTEEPVDKAITSMAVPRLPRAMAQEMIRRNAQSVMTRGNSRFAKDIHTGPLTGEVIEMVEADAQERTHHEVFKACGMCGRRYRLFKGVDSGCPTCSINKSSHCNKCGKQLVKSHGGSVLCPLCG